MFFPNFERVCEEIKKENEPEIEKPKKQPVRNIFNELYDLRQEMEWIAQKD